MSLRIYQDSVAIVTGAASGIGRALSEQLALAGAHVVLADVQAELVEEAAREIMRHGGRATAVELDVCDFDQVEAIVQQTLLEHGRIDFLFNNAGIGVGGDIEKHDAADWSRIIDVNVKGVANGVQAVVKPMMEQGFGHIVNTASISGLLAIPGAVAYATTKHAVVGLSKSLRGELRPAGIRVTAICPGAVDTPLLSGGKFGKFHGISPAVARRTLSSFPPVAPEHVAVKALAGIRKNRTLVIVPWQYRLTWMLLKRLPPAWEISIMTRHMSQRRADAERAAADLAAVPSTSADAVPPVAVAAGAGADEKE